MRIASAEAGMWALGAALIATYCGMRAHADVQRQNGISAFHLASSRMPPDPSRWSDGRIRAYAGTFAAQTLPEAVLRIPSVQLAVPVYADTNETNLNRGAGLIAGTARPEGTGNVGIAAHRDGFFRALKDVAVGDRLEVESLSGTRVYRVTRLSIVSPDDISVLRQTPQATVTLVTCYPFYFVGDAPQRYVVRALAVD